MQVVRLFRRRPRRFLRFATTASAQQPVDPTPSDVTTTIKLIPKDLHRRLFGASIPSNYVEDEEAKAWLSKLALPPLLTTTGVFDHVTALGRAQFQPYKRLFESALTVADRIPDRPSSWNLAVGWTKYEADGTYKKVEAPSEEVLFFDIETCVPDGQLPTLAVALSSTHWYSWCSSRLVDLTPVPQVAQLKHMIPLDLPGDEFDARLVIGHNVGYDRSRVREQFYRKPSATCFWDTMSMSIAYHGMAEHQRLLYEKKDANDTPTWTNEWRRRACKNSLADLYAKLFPDAPFDEVDKTFQSVFVTEKIEVIRDQFQRLTDYCANDVQLTCKVFNKLYPRFCKRFPNLITNVGMMIMANAYLPVTTNWRLFFEESERKTQTVNKTTTVALAKMAHELAGNLAADQNGDIKLRCMEFPRLFGLCYGPYPLFYKRDLGWGFLGLPSGTTEVPEKELVLLRATGDAYVPVKKIVELIEQNKRAELPEVEVSMEVEWSVGPLPFYRLKHPKGEGFNVGTPFVKDFHSLFHEGILRPTRFPDELKEILKSGSNTRFWGNYRDRYNEQVVAWFDENGDYGAIAPAVIPSGTITRRAVHKLWLTSTNAKEEMIGSQLKSMVECPPGWKLVGADVDSQEQWLAAIFGDSLSGTGHVGSTPFSQMQLAGTKSDGTDLHSVVARTVNINRNSAKILNYARLYGAGQLHATEFLKSQGSSANEAQEISAKLFESTKGRKMSYLELNPSINQYFEKFRETLPPNVLKDAFLYIEGRYFLASGYEHKVNQLFEDWLRRTVLTDGHEPNSLELRKIVYSWPQMHTLYTGGFESDTFNFLELRARAEVPRTPVLGCRLTSALEALPSGVPDGEDFSIRYKRTIINWLVQSSAVDYLHMLLVCMKWMCQEMNIEARFVISVHDEVRYMVPDQDKYRAAVALNISNMLVRAAISEKLGIRELPMSIAFFSQVDIDTILRKEVDLACTMPDGRVVPDGEAMTMKQLLEIHNPTVPSCNDIN